MTQAGQVLEIDVDQLEPDPDNIRKTYDEELIAGLATFLRNEGHFVEYPVGWQVGKLADGRPLFRAYSGSTRAQAARRVGGKITITVLPGEPDRPAKIRGQLSAAALKKDLSPLEIALALREIQREPSQHEGAELSIRDIKSQLDDIGIKRARSWISNHLRIISTEPAVQEMFHRRELPVDAIGILLAVTGPAQIELANRIRAGWDWRSQQVAETSAELAYQDVDEKVSEMAALKLQPVRAKHRTVERDRRSGPLTKRYGLIGLPDVGALSDIARPHATGRSHKQAPSAELPAKWVTTATSDERALAAEVAAMEASYSDEEVIHFVEQLMAEVREVPEQFTAALNLLGQVLRLQLEGAPGGLRSHPAMTSMLRMRCQALLWATDALAR